MAEGTEIYRVEAVPFGQLFIMPRPRANALARDIKHYQSVGVETVVSLMEMEEAAQLGLASEKAECLAAGLEFVNFPISDFSVPERRAFLGFVNELAALLRDGRAVAVHCRAGIGRSGMVVCSIAGALGVPEAIDVVSRARGVEVPDTAEQRAFIESVLLEYS